MMGNMTDAEKFEKFKIRRATEADYLNSLLRENYGDLSQVRPEADWRNAFMALVNGARHGAEYQVKAKLKRATDAIRAHCVDCAGDCFDEYRSPQCALAEIYVALKEQERGSRE